jgi:hypothetical protein
MRPRVSRAALQTVSAVLAIVAAVALAIANVWPFDTSPPALPEDPTLWQLMLSDDITLGFARLGIVLLAVFVIASVPALIVGGRWIKTFGTSGLTADDAADASKALEETKTTLGEVRRQLEVVEQERDEALRELRSLIGGG